MNSEQVHNAHEVYGNLNLPKPESAGADEGHQAIERPKLNLKPRSQTIEQSEGSADRERSESLLCSFISHFYGTLLNIYKLYTF